MAFIQCIEKDHFKVKVLTKCLLTGNWNCCLFSSVQVFTSNLKVEEGGLCIITEGHILVSDEDTKLENIHFLLIRSPLHGTVELDGIPMSQGDRMAWEDVHMSKVRLEEKNAAFVLIKHLGFQPMDSTMLQAQVLKKDVNY